MHTLQRTQGLNPAPLVREVYYYYFLQPARADPTSRDKLVPARPQTHHSTSYSQQESPENEMTRKGHWTSECCLYSVLLALNLVCLHPEFSREHPDMTLWIGVMTTVQPSSSACPMEKWDHHVWDQTQLSHGEFSHDDSILSDSWILLSSSCATSKWIKRLLEWEIFVLRFQISWHTLLR